VIKSQLMNSNEALNKVKQISILRRSYYDFFIWAWDIIEPATPLVDNWHIKYLCDLLQIEVERIAAKKPKTKDLIINIPPRSLKSMIITITLNAWAWLRYPQLKFISASYNSSLAIEHAVKTRRIIESNEYQEIYLNSFKMTGDQNVKSMFENNKFGFRKSVGTGGGVTGSGADILLIDDPISPELAFSDVERNTCINWFKETMYSRLNDQTIGLRIVIMQRLHQDDLTGWLLANQKGRWEYICIPATDDYPVSPECLKKNYIDNCFFKGRFTKDILAQSKEVLGSSGFAGQYGQQPVPSSGGMFKRNWWKFYLKLPESFEVELTSWDMTFKGGAKNDYVVGTVWGYTDGKYYLRDMVRAKMDFVETKQAVRSLLFKYPEINMHLVEDKANGSAIISELKNEFPGFIPIEPEGDKTSRASAVTPTVESGNVYLPDPSLFPWVHDVIEECSLFPLGKHDDIVDSITQALRRLINRYISHSFFA